MSTRAVVPVVLAGLVGLSFACSPADVAAPVATGSDSDSGMGGSNDAGLAGDDGGVDFACQNYAFGYCNRLNACSATIFQMRYGGETVCETNMRTQCLIENLAPSSTQTPASTASCTTALADLDCTDFVYNQNRPPACQDETIGLLPIGGACGINQQCASGYCAQPLGQACGSCATAPAAGASCATYDCPFGLTCVQSTCVALANQGTSCSTAQPCTGGLTCTGGICQPDVATAGATCSISGAGCSEVAGLTCNAMTSTCATLQLAVPGQACGLVADQNVVCFAGGCVRGACVSLLQPGAPCVLGSGPACMTPTRCIVTSDGGTTGTCQFSGSAACN